jgi:GntR family transcriptional regulator
MIPFRLVFRPGTPIVEQVVYAAKKAIVAGQLRPGDQFPSVRALSRELKINPNTAHKVVSQLLDSGLLEVVPGIGTAIRAPGASSAAERRHLLKTELEQLVVEAKKLGLEMDEVVDSLAEHWCRLDGKKQVERP